MIYELYINNSKVELSGAFEIYLNFATGDHTDMTSICNNGSYTISLPLTAHNIQTFEYVNLPGSVTDMPSKEHTARLVRGGIPIFEDGKAVILGVGKTIDIQLIWNRNEKLVEIKDRKMRTLELDDLMRLDPDNIEQYETEYLRWFYDTGYRQMGVHDVKGFRPAISVSYLINKILPPFSCKIRYMSFIESLWIMLPTMNGNADILSKIGFDIFGSYDYTAVKDKRPDIINRMTSSYTGAYNLLFQMINSRDDYDYIYIPKKGSYRFNGTVNASISDNSFASFKIIKNRILTRDNSESGKKEEYEILLEQKLFGTPVLFDSTFQLELGEKVSIILTYTTEVSNYVTFNLNVSYDVLAADNTDTAYLLDYPIRENLPDITMLDFVKGIFGTMGLMTEHTADGLHMFTVDDVIISTDRKDISKMLVNEKNKNIAFSRGLTMFNTLSYKNKTDYITFPADTYDKTEHAVVTLPFVLSRAPLYTHNSRTKTIDLVGGDNSKDTRLYTFIDTKPIVIYKRYTGGSSRSLNEDNTRTVLLSTFSIEEITFKTLADTFWRGYIGTFSITPRIVTRLALLTPDFVQNLSFSQAVYDGQNYYMLLRVSDYDKHGLALLEMALIDGIDLSAIDISSAILPSSGKQLISFEPGVLTLY